MNRETRRSLYARPGDGRVREAVRSAVYERDGGVCQICGTEINCDAPENTAWAPSLDHIEPWSDGGEWTVENLRLAHVRCNHQRHA